VHRSLYVLHEMYCDFTFHYMLRDTEVDIEVVAVSGFMTCFYDCLCEFLNQFIYWHVREFLHYVEMSGQLLSSATLFPGKSPCSPLVWRLNGAQSRPGRG
jgi:hypothetical protein